ncbi:helix-turn-helix domain-containing protein [Nitratidesulfovibrio termitidis]|uniref:helix-turn-helix domain-containing protein n=1 Tax=Nitratidesulfovibrio termitidis TaxID=42252 RepID=UPI0003FF3B26|nr:helix-turn-helix domain-containing protein [Nitratidesulfovibrio termitidis]
MAKTTFTLAEAADLLSCHKETLRRAIKDGTLRAARLGRGYRISRSDLEAFWTAQGGGALFGDGESPADVPPTERPAPSKAKKPEGPRQLTLPTS